jgi:hypothetical protein
MDISYPAHRYPPIAYNIDVMCWPKRRRAILYLIDNIHRQKHRENVLLLAGLLAEKCETNFHPMCANVIRYYIERAETVMGTGVEEGRSLEMD